MNKKTKNMTVGSPTGLILGFALPLLVGFIFQNLYNLVDTAIVGRCLGVDALAAVGTTGSLNFMIINFCIGTTAGFSIPVAQRFGAGDESQMRRYVYNAAVLSAIFAVIVTLVICIFTRPILHLIRVPEEILPDAWKYIFIIFLGIPITYFYNLCAGIIRSLGDSKTPVYFLILASVLNGILDLMTILILGMGVEGPAAATVFSQLVAAVLCYRYMKKRFPILRMQPEEHIIEGKKLKNLCSMGIPMGLQYTITAIGTMLNQAAVNALGTLSVAAFAAGGKVSVFLACPYDALGSTMATYVGQNIGAGQTDRVKKGVISANLIGMAYGCSMFAVMLFTGESIGALFLGAGEVQAVAQAALLLRTYSAFYFLLTIVNVVRFSIQGMGYSGLAIFAGVCEMVGRGSIGLFLVPRFGYHAACFASPLAWLLADLFLIPAFLWCLKRKEKTL